MPLLLIDYTNLVLKDYEEKRNTNQLSQLLMHPTTGSIKQECINVYAERLKAGEQVEENTLRAFFGILPDGRNFGDLIEWCGLGKFKSIQKLIRKEVKIPSSANVELLAWLIDFKPRPLSRAEKILGNNIPSLPGPVVDPTKPAAPQNALPIEPVNIPNNGKKNSNNLTGENKGEGRKNIALKIAAATCLMLIIIFGAIYIPQRQNPGEKSYGTTNTGCMYWSNDHYEQVPCNEERKGWLILPFNEEKWRNFKRITREDTISEQSIEKIYYIKREGKIEYFTAGGNHPVEVTRSLKILTQYMFNKYLRKKDSLNKDSLPESNSKLTSNP